MKLIAGSSGVVGSGFCDALRAQGEPYARLRLPWHDPEGVARRVVEGWHAAQRSHPGDPVTLVWAAGTGRIAAPASVMANETHLLDAVVDGLARAVRPDAANCVLFVSSAGALYGGHRGTVIKDDTPPVPITPYGREKLLQERSVARLAEAGLMRAVSCRFTNVYGLAGGRLRRRGLVAALVDSALLRQPVRIFVSPDTRRDYLYNVDAARLALAEAEVTTPGSAPARIIRSGSTTTVLDLVATISRVLRRRVPVVISESAERTVQPLVLSFEPRTGVQGTIATTAFATAIRTMAEAPRA